jgi:polyketide cyclase/dehydrase/lipid transport protein
MSAVREQALLDAPISTVWELGSDLRRYPEWFPRVFEINGERFEEGAEFVMLSHQPFVGRDEARFLIDRVDELREIRMHCTVSGFFVHWQLTDAQGRHLPGRGVRNGPDPPPRPPDGPGGRPPLPASLAHGCRGGPEASGEAAPGV